MSSFQTIRGRCSCIPSYEGLRVHAKRGRSCLFYPTLVLLLTTAPPHPESTRQILFVDCLCRRELRGRGVQYLRVSSQLSVPCSAPTPPMLFRLRGLFRLFTSTGTRATLEPDGSGKWPYTRSVGVHEYQDIHNLVAFSGAKYLDRFHTAVCSTSSSFRSAVPSVTVR